MIATQSKSASRNFVSAFEYNHNKMSHKEEDKRAVLLDHNFNTYSKRDVLAELKMLKQLKPNVNRDGFHVSISFSPEDRYLTDHELSKIAHDYMRGMGFSSDNNLFAIWRHEDGVDDSGKKHEHQHIHLLCTTIGFDGSVVNLGNNYRRSQKLTRDLEKQYNLVEVKPAQGVQIKSPSKNEIEMVLRTNTALGKMLLQQKLLSALESSKTLDDFIYFCKENGVYLLFNQPKSGYVSGLTYIMDNGFMANASKIGDSFKWNNLKNILSYEQTRQSETISRTNIDTRDRFKDFFERRARENSQKHSTSREKSNTDQQFSRGDRRSTYDVKQQKDDHTSRSSQNRDGGAKQEVQEVDETIYSKSSSYTSAFVGVRNGFLDPYVSQVEDEDNINKNRRKRRR